MVVKFLTFLLKYLGALLSQCNQNIQTSYMCLLLNGVTVISATQIENAWFSPKHKESNVTIQEKIGTFPVP